jgi:hypothetical protein
VKTGGNILLPQPWPPIQRRGGGLSAVVTWTRLLLLPLLALAVCYAAVLSPVEDLTWLPQGPVGLLLGDGATWNGTIPPYPETPVQALRLGQLAAQYASLRVPPDGHGGGVGAELLLQAARVLQPHATTPLTPEQLVGMDATLARIQDAAPASLVGRLLSAVSVANVAWAVTSLGVLLGVSAAVQSTTIIQPFYVISVGMERRGLWELLAYFVALTVVGDGLRAFPQYGLCISVCGVALLVLCAVYTLSLHPRLRDSAPVVSQHLLCAFAAAALAVVAVRFCSPAAAYATVALVDALLCHVVRQSLGSGPGLDASYQALSLVSAAFWISVIGTGVKLLMPGATATALSPFARPVLLFGPVQANAVMLVLPWTLYFRGRSAFVVALTVTGSCAMGYLAGLPVLIALAVVFLLCHTTIACVHSMRVQCVSPWFYVSIASVALWLTTRWLL